MGSRHRRDIYARALQGGLPLALTPLVLIGVNLIYALSTYSVRNLSDSVSHTRLLVFGLLLLIAGDALLAWSTLGVDLGRRFPVGIAYGVSRRGYWLQ